MQTSPHTTKERILTAAEELFARHGFDGASLRQLTAAAGVNLAAVNYHFGSKDRLIEEVFRRRLDQLNGHRMTALSPGLLPHCAEARLSCSSELDSVCCEACALPSRACCSAVS